MKTIFSHLAPLDLRSVRCATGLCVFVIALTGSSAHGGTEWYPLAFENPVMDGAFTTSQEYAGAVKEPDALNVGYFYKQHVWNWTVGSIPYNNTTTFFNNHYFSDSHYGQLDMYDQNSFEVRYGNHTIKTWVFLAGNEPTDAWWLDIVGIGAANYPSGFNDDGGFLVRLDNDPSTDRIWHSGDAKPGDAGWNFGNYYGIFAQGGFNNSAFAKNYDSVVEDREIYEWSLTLNQGFMGSGGWQPGGIPGVAGPGGIDNPDPPDGFCDPLWVEFIKYREVKDWKKEMGGYGTYGGIGWVPDGTEWVQMGFDVSMHPIPEPSTLSFLVASILAVFLGAKKSVKLGPDLSAKG